MIKCRRIRISCESEINRKIKSISPKKQINIWSEIKIHMINDNKNLIEHQNEYKKYTCEKNLHKDLAHLHCKMFKLTHPSSLPGRKRHTQLGIVWKGACHLASLRLFLSLSHTHINTHTHTHMHTLLGQLGIAPNNRRLGLVFPWQSALAIFPRWQRNRVLSVAKNHVCVCVVVYVCI